MTDLLARLSKWGLRSETAVAVVLAVALLLILWPLPGPVLDLLLAVNFTVALTVLLVTLFTARPVDLSALPETLVLASLARVVLCLGVARRLLQHGQPGALVETLGLQLTQEGEQSFVGLAVLIILAVVSFLVITAGVMRLAEVGARFALDALPGRQMGIDAALAGGRMAVEVGHSATRQLDVESSFYGAMDGVARFLRGEVIATLIIVGVTPVAALASGAMHGVSDLLSTTLPQVVGHGIVILVPGMLMGAAAAVALARSGAQGTALAHELLLRPYLLAAVAGVLLVLGSATGIGGWALFILALLVGAVAWMLSRHSTATTTEVLPDTASVRVEIGLGLIGLLAQQDLMGTLNRTWARLADELGFALPAFTVADCDDLQVNEYRLWLGSEVWGKGVLRPGQRLAVPAAEGVLPSGGVETTLPDGTPAAWVGPDEETRLRALGCHVLSATEVLALHLEQNVRKQAAQFFDLQRASELLGAVRLTHPASVLAFESRGQSLELLRDVGRLLLAEGISLTDRVSLIEALASAPTENALVVNEVVRPALAHTITRMIASDGRAEVVAMDPVLETELQRTLEQAGSGLVTLSPDRVQAWYRGLHDLSERYGRMGRPAVLLCSEKSRRVVGQLVRECGASVVALRASELEPLTTLMIRHQLEAAELDMSVAWVATRE